MVTSLQSTTKIKQKLSCRIFSVFLSFYGVLLVLICFQRFWTIFGGFGQIQKSKMADQDGRNYNVM